MLTRDEIRAGLSAALDRASNGRAKLDRLDDGARIIEDVGLSSLDLLDLRCELEERWHIKLADEDLMQLRTIDDVIRSIEERDIATKPASA